MSSIKQIITLASGEVIEETDKHLDDAALVLKRLSREGRGPGWVQIGDTVVHTQAVHAIQLDY